MFYISTNIYQGHIPVLGLKNRRYLLQGAPRYWNNLHRVRSIPQDWKIK